MEEATKIQFETVVNQYTQAPTGIRAVVMHDEHIVDVFESTDAQHIVDLISTEYRTDSSIPMSAVNEGSVYVNLNTSELSLCEELDAIFAI